MNKNKILAESIAKEYFQKQNSDIVALKKLDAKAKRPARVFAYTFGTFFVLVAGTGMCFAMQVIGAGMTHMLMGIALGVIGFTACAVNYPVYKKILNRGKKKYAADIVKLAHRICEEE